MRALGLFVLCTVVLFSCESNKNSTKEVKSLSFEEIVKQHTMEYCSCAVPLNDFVNSVDVSQMDSSIYAQYQQLQAQFEACFDPRGDKKQFRDGLTMEQKKQQKELFNQYRQELCPEVVPKS
jgi:hypothetical protein